MTTLNQIEEKVNQGIRISEADALFLYEHHDLLRIGSIANKVSYKKHQSRVFYNVNRHINPTNICVMSCKFCAFARKPGQEGAYAYSNEEILSKAKEAVEQGATEVHMVGGLHPRWNLDHYKTMINLVKSEFPQLHIKGFTAVEIDWLAKKSRKTVQQVLIELHESGLGSLPGGGAEIFHEDIREQITAKLSTDDWLNIHKTAHDLGMQSNCTMLYGHVESYEHRVYHMHRLRLLQDQTQGFNAFIPLSFQPHNNEMGIDRYTFGYDDLKNIAVARIFLDNFDHIKAYWIMMGQDIAQLAMHFGANDLDGTVLEEKISNMAGGRSGNALTKTNIRQIISKAGHIPVERDTVYNAIEKERPQNKTLIHDQRLLTSLLEKSLVEPLSIENLIYLANHSNLYELSNHAALIGKEKFSYDQCVSWAPCIEINYNIQHNPKSIQKLISDKISLLSEHQSKLPLNIVYDLSTVEHSSDQIIEFDKLMSILKSIRNNFESLSLTCMGIKGLWRIVQANKMSLGEAFKNFSQIGLSSFESSPFETETGLTNSELINLQHAAHQYDLATVSKVELSIPPHGQEPLWHTFFERLTALDELQKHNGGLIGLSIEAARDSHITASEYWKAVALARIASNHIPNIITSLKRIPTLSPKSSAKAQVPEEKIAGLFLLSGSNDLGHIPMDYVKEHSIFEIMSSCGFKPKVRNSRFNSCDHVPSKNEDLRHCPKPRNFEG